MLISLNSGEQESCMALLINIWTTPHLQTSVRVCHTDLQDLLQEVDEYKLAHSDQVAVISVMTSPRYEGIPTIKDTF